MSSVMSFCSFIFSSTCSSWSQQTLQLFWCFAGVNDCTGTACTCTNRPLHEQDRTERPRPGRCGAKRRQVSSIPKRGPSPPNTTSTGPDPADAARNAVYSPPPYQGEDPHRPVLSVKISLAHYIGIQALFTRTSIRLPLHDNGK
jgi:hypothetical protein